MKGWYARFCRWWYGEEPPRQPVHSSAQPWFGTLSATELAGLMLADEQAKAVNVLTFSSRYELGDEGRHWTGGYGPPFEGYTGRHRLHDPEVSG